MGVSGVSTYIVSLSMLLVVSLSIHIGTKARITTLAAGSNIHVEWHLGYAHRVSLAVPVAKMMLMSCYALFCSALAKTVYDPKEHLPATLLSYKY